MFLVLFDSLAVATALPTIAGQLHLSPSRLQWVVTLNSIAIGALLIVGGRLSDMLGRRRVLVASLGVLTAGSLLAGVAPGLPLLLAGRILQGIAGAFALPASLAMTGSLFPTEPWRSRAFSVWSIAAGAAGLIGAVCGGLLTAGFGWRWVFLVPLPLTVLALVATLVFLPGDAPSSARAKLDLGGAFLVTAGLVCLIFGIGRIGQSGHAALAVAAPLVGASLLFAGFVSVERRLARRGAPAPLVPLALLRERRLAAACLATAANSATYVAVLVVGSLDLQDVHGLSAAGTGLALTPSLLGTGLAGVAAAALVRRLGSRLVAGGALSLGGLSLALLAFGPTGSSLTLIAAWFFLRGVSGGLTYVALTRECIGGPAEADRSTRSGIFEATTHVAGAVAVAVYLSLVASHLGYGSAYLAGAVFAGAGALAAFVLLPRRVAEGPTAGRPRGSVIWITGLSGAGKSTVAGELAARLRADGVDPVLLDGDQLRAALGADGGGYDADSRRRLAFVYARLCRLLAEQGHTVVCATIALHHEVHAWNRANIPGYLEVFLDVPLEELRRRDFKGVYEGQGAVGVGLEAEFPTAPDLTLRNFASVTAGSAGDAIYHLWRRTDTAEKSSQYALKTLSASL
jgi:adenylylsulfate kinase-like enzyme/predicted MFS family arabinose efflux permease